MDTALLVTAIIVSVCSLAVSVVFLCLYLKSRNVENYAGKDAEEMVRMQTSLQTIHNEVQNLSVSLLALKENIPNLMKAESSSQMALIEKTLNAETKAASESLLSFQKGLGEIVNGRMDKMNEALLANTSALNKKVDDNFKDINDRVNKSLEEGFKGNSDTMGELKKQLGAIDEAQKHLVALQNDVTNLNQVLSSSQSRGAFGELQLEMLLESTFPHGKGVYYNLQEDLGYTSKEGEKVRPDADLLFSVNGTTSRLCIDSKFPFADYAKLFSNEAMEENEKATLKASFKNAIRNQYKEIADKYIIQGVSMRYAVMFIPNDGIFAYIENEFPDLVNESRGLGVILACPATLQAIIVVFHNAAMEAERNKNIEQINEALKGLSVEFQRFAARWNDVQRTIQNANNKSELLGTTVGKISRKFDSINKGDLSAISTIESTNPALDLKNEEEEKDS